MLLNKRITIPWFVKSLAPVVCILLSCLLLSCDSNRKAEKESANNKQVSDLTDHPVYSTYHFGQDDKIIDFGTQPLAVPTGTLAEVMQRDQVLKNLLTEAGFTLRLHSFSKGSDINFFMRRGNIDLAVAGDMPTLLAAANNDVVVIALVKQNFSSIITKNIVKLEDLKGRRVGYSPGSSAHYLLLNALKTVELTEDDVILVPLKVSEMTDALEQGTIDAFSAWEPTPTIALKKIKSAKVLHRAITSSYLYCSKTFLEQHPETVKLLIASVTRSMKWMTLTNVNVLAASDWSMQAVKKFTDKNSILNRHEYGKLIQDGFIKVASSPIVPRSVLMEGGQIQKEFVFLQQNGLIPSEITWATTLENFNRKMMTEVLNNPDQFQLNTFKFE